MSLLGILVSFSKICFDADTFLTGTKLSEDSRKYGAEKTCTSGSTLSKAALSFGRARAQMEKERGNLLKAFGTQVGLILSFLNEMLDTPNSDIMN